MSFLGNLATDTGHALAGIIKKAVIIVPTAKKSPANPAAAASAAMRAANVLQKATTHTALSAAKGLTAEPGFHLLEVQYNPATLSIQSNAKQMAYHTLQKNMDDGIPRQKLRNPSVTLVVDLIFDDVNNMDAFMADKLRVFSVGGIANAASGLARTAKGGAFSVQPQTDALLAAILRSKTREITFRWAGMSFTGVLAEISANYTMFSVSGRPIRSNVRMKLIQEVKKNADLQYWDNAFNNTFGGPDEAKESGDRGILSKMGNLINL